jgi:hypothetical protein
MQASPLFGVQPQQLLLPLRPFPLLLRVRLRLLLLLLLVPEIVALVVGPCLAECQSCG